MHTHANYKTLGKIRRFTMRATASDRLIDIKVCARRWMFLSPRAIKNSMSSHVEKILRRWPRKTIVDA